MSVISKDSDNQRDVAGGKEWRAKVGMWSTRSIVTKEM